MTQVALQDAQTHLSDLADRASHGEVIVLTRDGKAVAHIVPPVATDLVKPPLDELLARFRRIRESSSAAAPTMTPQDAVAKRREIRQGSRLTPGEIREMIEEGRKY